MWWGWRVLPYGHGTSPPPPSRPSLTRSGPSRAWTQSTWGKLSWPHLGERKPLFPTLTLSPRHSHSRVVPTLGRHRPQKGTQLNGGHHTPSDGQGGRAPQTRGVLGCPRGCTPPPASLSVLSPLSPASSFDSYATTKACGGVGASILSTPPTRSSMEATRTSRVLHS